MVQKYVSPVRIYKHPFELVMAAYEKRFPTCKMIPVFVGSEIMKDDKSEDGAVHVVKRRCQLNPDAPYLLKKICGFDYIYFIQTNALNRRERTLEIEAYNESFSSRVSVVEHCVYTVHPENPEWTCFEQDASLDIKSFFGFESTVERLAMKQYTANIKKGKEVIEYYIQELVSEGITSLPKWKTPVTAPHTSITSSGKAAVVTGIENLEPGSGPGSRRGTGSSSTYRAPTGGGGGDGSGGTGRRRKSRTLEVDVPHSSKHSPSIEAAGAAFSYSDTDQVTPSSSSSTGDDGGGAAQFFLASDEFFPAEDGEGEGDQLVAASAKSPPTADMSFPYRGTSIPSKDNTNNTSCDTTDKTAQHNTVTSSAYPPHPHPHLVSTSEVPAGLGSSSGGSSRAPAAPRHSSASTVSNSFTLTAKLTPPPPQLSAAATCTAPHSDSVTVPPPVLPPKHSPSPGTTASTSAREASLSSSSTNPQKLEDEYIERYLGELTPFQESCLVRLRRYIRDTHKGKIPKDSHILRFLRARDFSFEDAKKMLCHSLAWRKRHNIDTLLETYKPPYVLRDYYAGDWHYFDRDGRPVYILRLGNMDVKGLLKSVGEEGLLRHVIAGNEMGLRKADENTKTSGHPVSSCTCIVDLENLSMRHLWRPGIRALLRIIETVEANYPETMGRLLIVRAPRVFPVIWTLISPFIDENTRKKFMIYAGNDYLRPGGLVDFIEEKFIPDFLNGDCYCDITEGGMVPRDLYLYVEKDFEEGRGTSEHQPPMCEESLYQVAYVVKDYPQEVLVQVPQRSSVITWDFDVLKGSVTFTIFRARRPLSTESRHNHGQGSGDRGHAMSTQYIDHKAAAIGVDFSIIEPPVVCRDGDSMQGSHVAGQPGSYILQWKYHDPKGSISLSTHKSKVMYYTELLKSEDFRGSMTSLQSSQSGFSSLNSGSLATNNSSHLTGNTIPSR